MKSAQMHSEEEGFFSDQIEIKKNSPKLRKPSISATYTYNPSQNGLIPNYLAWTGPLMKQPIEAHNTQLPWNNSQQQTVTQKSPFKEKQKKIQQGHPFSLYAKNQNYHLVYARTPGTQSPIRNDINFISHEIQLRHVGKPQSNSSSRKIENFKVKKTEKGTHELLFDSRFEGGNLHCAYKQKNKQEYILFVSNDTNSLGYTQWFYFSVRNNRPSLKYTFHIVNFRKKHSFFKNGQKISVFSLTDAKKTGRGWRTAGEDIFYTDSTINFDERHQYYSLSFTLNFEHDNDYIMIAMSVPYSFSRLVNLIVQMKQHIHTIEHQSMTPTFEIETAAKTLCGNNIPELTITSRKQISVEKFPHESHYDEEKKIEKKMIIILARQHSGQVWSSFMMQGIIRQLLFASKGKDDKKSEYIKWLLRHYVIKIYPMVNIDGVIYGNSRCDITGSDLNRKWRDSSRILYPQIHQIKKRISYFKRHYQIDLCYDLHGHSKNYNIFTYGCRDNMYTCRILPFLISKNTPLFYMPSCTFGLSKYKQTTARAVIYHIIKTENVLTVQASYYGAKSRGDSTVLQFTDDKIFKFASDLLKGTRAFLDHHPPSDYYDNALKQIKSNFQQYVKYDQMNGSDSGSDSDPECDQIDINVKIKQIFDSGCVNIDTIYDNRSKQLSKQLDEKNSTMNKTKFGKKLSIISNHIERPPDKILKKIQSRTIEPKKTNINDDEVDKKTDEFDFRRNKYSFHKKKDKRMLEETYTKLQEIPKRFITNNPPSSLGNSLKYQQEKKTVESLPISMDSRSFRKEARQSKLKKQIESPDVIENRLRDIRKSDEFVRKLQRFVPISMSSLNKSAGVFEQTIYNQDQNGLISMLYENKKKIDMEKIRRDVEKSTKVVERHNKFRTARANNVIDFKAFKQNEKINKNIKKVVKLDYLHYLKDE